jgi:bifunctional non-homologous end joining protein LigD
VNIGSIELHTSLHLAQHLQRPTVLAFDLDPGPGTGLLECCEVALRLRELLGGAGLASYAKTSGSKGLQVYVPLNADDLTYEVTKPVSRRIAELLESETPDAVVSKMAKKLRPGKVLVDWSQNTEHKSMVCAYSVRAKERPTVSAPVTWDEVETDDPRSLVFEIDDALERFEERGDLFAAVLTQRQQLS